MRPKVQIVLAGILLMALVLPRPLSAWGEKRVTMKPEGPTCNLEVVYRLSAKGQPPETYSVHAEEIMVKGVPAYQSISVYPDRVRRITMRRSDLTPLFMIEKWDREPKLIERTYYRNTVHVVRQGVPDPIDVAVEAPAGVHDPESFAFLLRGYPFAAQDTIAPIEVLIADPNPLFSRPRALGVYIIPRGEERITVPAGRFDCYVLEMTLAGALGYVVPNNRFWLLKEDPHLLVKAEGAGTLIELVSGAAACDGKTHCAVRAQVPDVMP